MSELKKRVVIFGTGRILLEYIQDINPDEVVGFVDNSPQKIYQIFYGRMVLPPSRISEFTFDYVVIFNQKYREEIYHQLIDLGVDGARIINWQYYLYVVKRNVRAFSRQVFPSILDIIHTLSAQSILDIDSGVEKNGFYIAGTDLRGSVSHIDSYCRDGAVNPNIYRNSINSCCRAGVYDIITFIDYYADHTVEEMQDLIRQTYYNSKYVLLTVPYAYPDEWTKWSETDFSEYGMVMELPLRPVRLILIKKEVTGMFTGSAAVYAVSHKTFRPPEDRLYVPIFAGDGRLNGTGMLTDSTGDHISGLNPKINELTAVYWIWKNTHTDIVGVCHYRRYLALGLKEGSAWQFDLLDRDRIEDDLKAFDMIVANAQCFYPLSVSEQLERTVTADAFDTGMKMVRDRIMQVCPEYIRDFEECFQGFIMYPCNMFITEWNVFSDYCKWLFGIVTDVADSIDVSMYESYSRRIVGFIAERLLTVWIRHNGIRVKEYPVKLTE